jgi:hypothetical protein
VRLSRWVVATVPGGEAAENDTEGALGPLVAVIAQVSGRFDQWCVLAEGGVAFGVFRLLEGEPAGEREGSGWLRREAGRFGCPIDSEVLNAAVEHVFPTYSVVVDAIGEIFPIHVADREVVLDLLDGVRDSAERAAGGLARPVVGRVRL